MRVALQVDNPASSGQPGAPSFRQLRHNDLERARLFRQGRPGATSREPAAPRQLGAPGVPPPPPPRLDPLVPPADQGHRRLFVCVHDDGRLAATGAVYVTNGDGRLSGRPRGGMPIAKTAQLPAQSLEAAAGSLGRSAGPGRNDWDVC